MAGFECDVIVTGSDFGGSVATLRAVEKGQSVCLLETVPSGAPGEYRLNHELSITDVLIGDQPQDR